MQREPIALVPHGGAHLAEEARAFWYRLEMEMPDHVESINSIDGLDAVTIAALTAEDTRPQYLAHKTGALLILRGVNAAPGAAPEDMVSLRMWIDHAMVVTYQLRRLDVVDDLARELAQGAGPETPGEFIVVLADRLTDRMQPAHQSLGVALVTIRRKILV